MNPRAASASFIYFFLPPADPSSWRRAAITMAVNRSNGTCNAGDESKRNGQKKGGKQIVVSKETQTLSTRLYLFFIVMISFFSLSDLFSWKRRQREKWILCVGSAEKKRIE